MAEKVELLKFDAGTKSLKELRTELKELKKALEETTIGSQEYQDILQEVVERQQQLSQITKSSVSDMEGSYNDLTKQLAELRKEWKSTNDEARRNELGSQMNEINNQLKELDASVGNFQRNVGNYQSALDGLEEKIASASEGYDNAIASSDKYVSSTDQLQKTMMAFVSTMAIAQTALDVMGVEGEEAEKIMADLQKVLAITAGFKAIAEGAKGFLQLSKTIKLATIASKGLRTALISTGIGALVVGVGLLIANWEKIASLWRDTSPQEQSEKAIKALTKATKELNDQMGAEVRQGKKDYLKSLQDAAGDEKKIQEATTKYESEQLKIRLNNRKAVLEEQLKNEKKQREAYLKLSEKDRKKEDNEVVKAWKEALDMVSETRNEIADIEIDMQRKTNDSLKERMDLYKEYVNKQKEAIGQLEDLLNAGNFFKETKLQYDRDKKEWEKKLDEKLITQEQYNQAILKLESDYAKKVQDEQLRLADEAQAKNDEKEETKKQHIEKRINNLYTLYQKKAELAQREFNEKMVDLSIAGDESGMKKLNDSFIQSQIELLNQLKAELAKYGDVAKDIVSDIEGEISSLTNEKKLTDKENSDEENEKRLDHVLELGDILIDTADAVGSAWSNVFTSINDGIAKVGESINKGEKGWTKYGKVASAGLGVASNMLGTLADMQDTQTKEGFEKNKKLQIASATMAMLAGIVNTWQSVMSKENSWMTIWGQVAAGSAISAMMLATGLAQINQIKSTSFEGGGSGSVAEPSITAMTAMQTPVDSVNMVQGASTESDIKDQRVYVVESDITSTQKNVKTTQSEATF